MKKRLLSLCLTAALCLTLLPTAAWAEEADPPDGQVVEASSSDDTEKQDAAAEADEPEDTAPAMQKAPAPTAAQSAENVAEVTSGGTTTQYADIGAAFAAAKDGDTITVKRMLEDGYMTIKVQTPCLLTCIKELNEPRYMSVGGVFEAYGKPLTTLGYEDLKDDPLIDATTIGLKGSPTNIFKSFTPPQKGAGMMLEGADKATCEKLAGILAAKHII